MRYFYTLDEATVNTEAGMFTLTTQTETEFKPLLSMRREGLYVAISVSYGPLEMALRPRYPELARVLSSLRPVVGLQTTRQVGTGQAYLALGLREDGVLVMRPTIVADATGLMCYNLLVAPAARETLYQWLPVIIESEG